MMEVIRLASLLFVFFLHILQTDEKIDEGTNIFYGNEKLKKTSREVQAEFLEAGAEYGLNDIRNLRDEEHPKDMAFLPRYTDLLAIKTKTTLNSKSNIFENVEDYPDNENDVSHPKSKNMKKDKKILETTKARSSRQRRTAQTPETSLVCGEEFSCRNRCEKARTGLYQTQLSCFCDEDCEFFLDCCADYDVFCGTNGLNMTNSTGHNTSLAENLVNQQNRDLWRCYHGDVVPGSIGVWMIGSCPSSWPEDDVLHRCRNLSETDKITKDNYRYLPVYTNNGRVYHNRFCAQCNGVSSKDLTEYALSIECDFTPPRHLSFESTLSFLFDYCSDIHWSPRKGENPRRYCLIIVSPVSAANSVSTLDIDINMTLAKCLTGKPGIVTKRYFYKNINCAKVDLNNLNEISCGPNITASAYGIKLPGETSHLPKPLSVIFDFNNANSKGLDSMQIKTRCPSEQVYDHYLDICRDALPALPSFSDIYEYQVVLWLKPGISKFEEDDFYRRVLSQALAVPIQHVQNIYVFQNISFTLQIRKNERLQPIAQNILEFTSPFKTTIHGLLRTVIKATKRILSCVNRQRYDRSEYTVLQDGSSTVVIKKTGEVFQSTDYYLNTTETSTSANDSQAIFVCRHQQISICSGVYILINEGEFKVLMNKSIFVNASKQGYDWSEYTWINKSVLVCENFSTTYYQSKVAPKDDPLLTTITIVSMSLSIIGLVFVLVTYSLFSELRTPPGINLMNLSVSILLAQLFWLLGSGQTDTPMVCTAIAVILHYFFLVSFVWTSIIAFDTWRAFSVENNAFPDSKREKCIKILRHVAVGWLPALVHVGICVGLDFTNTVSIGYRSRIACWMANKWAILYFFAVPVFIFLVFNIVFCSMTFRAIKTTTVQSGAALDNNTKKNFGIYLRITSLMGFTWISGFVAPFGWQLLWYPFVILNGLQGVYIALAFALNKRSRGLYKRTLGSKSPPQQAASLSTIARLKTHDSSYNESVI